MSAVRVTPAAALAAVREAADAWGRSPQELTITEYRRYRTIRASADDALPSHLAISMVLGGWRRACGLAAGTREAARATGP